MPFCSIKWCGKNSKTSSHKIDAITFHRFPKEPRYKEKWIEVTRRENWFPSSYSVICSRHFTEDCFMECNNRRRLLSTAIPTQFLPVLESEETIFTVDGIQPFTSNPTLMPPSAPVTEGQKVKSDHELIPSFTSLANKRLCRRILELNSKLAKKNGQLKRLREKCRYLQNRLNTLKGKLKDGKEAKKKEEDNNPAEENHTQKDVDDELKSPERRDGSPTSSERDVLETME